MVKVLVLKMDSKVLVSKIREVGAEVGEPDCRLINPFRITDEGVFVRWPAVTDQRTLMIHSDSILTIVDPSEDIMKEYKEAIS